MSRRTSSTKVMKKKTKFIDVCSGSNHIILLHSSHIAYSMGANYFGQLGHKNRSNCPYPKRVHFKEPTQIASVACGAHHSVFLTSSGAVYACGKNYTGACGAGKECKILNTPTQIRVINGCIIEKIFCGKNTTFLLDNKGVLYTCGSNSQSQLGLQENNVYVPTKIEIPNETIEYVSSGLNHTLFLCRSKNIYATGSNEFNQCGINIGKLIPRPTIVPLKNIRTICCGKNGTIFLTENNKVVVCGKNDYLRFGENKAVIKKPTLISAPPNIIDMRCGNETCMYLTDEKRVYLCGVNLQLGVLDEALDELVEKKVVAVQINRSITKISMGTGFCYLLSSEGPVLFGLSSSRFMLVVKQNDDRNLEMPFKITPTRRARFDSLELTDKEVFLLQEELPENALEDDLRKEKEKGTDLMGLFKRVKNKEESSKEKIDFLSSINSSAEKISFDNPDDFVSFEEEHKNEQSNNDEIEGEKEEEEGEGEKKRKKM